MKCPHCNQEHPEEFLFCPKTDKKIVSLKACPNLMCTEYGKHVLPMDYVFCPICGFKLEEQPPVRDEKTEDIIGDECFEYEDDLHKFFPVAGITLGESIFDEVKLPGQYNISGLLTGSTDNTVTAIDLDHVDPMFSEWEDMGFNWGLSYADWKDLFFKMGFSVKEQKKEFQKTKKKNHKEYSYAKFRATSSDCSIQFVLEFYGELGCDSTSKNTLDSILVTSKKAPYWKD